MGRSRVMGRGRGTSRGGVTCRGRSGVEVGVGVRVCL